MKKIKVFRLLRAPLISDQGVFFLTGNTPQRF